MATKKKAGAYKVKNIHYYNNREQDGIIYDWHLIKSTFNKLGVPAEYDFTPWEHITEAKYFIQLSQRGLGKTTSALLLGMVMNSLYGTLIEYVRVSRDEIKASTVQEMMNVIEGYKGGKYIEILTDGKYNSTYYHWKELYYCRKNEEGKVEEMASVPFLHFSSIDDAKQLKSGYNSPKGDFILLDEFIGDLENRDMAYHFLDLIKTIIRDRLSPVVFMLSNGLDATSIWWDELEIASQVRSMKLGEEKLIKTEKGTKLFVQAINSKKEKKLKTMLNSLFFGFKNPKMTAITGEGELFAGNAYPHFTFEQTDKRKVFNNVVIVYGVEKLRVGLFYSKELGYHIEVMRANNREFEDDVILSTNTAFDLKHQYGLGDTRLNKILGQYIQKRKVYFSSNEVGRIWSRYVNTYLSEKNRY